MSKIHDFLAKNLGVERTPKQEVSRLYTLLSRIEDLAIEQEKRHGITFENSKIAELARERLQDGQQ